MSVKTLAMEPTGSDRYRTSFLPKIFIDVRQDLSYGAVHGSFGHPYFRVHFCKKFSWTSVKTLAMEPVGHDGKIIPFSRSNSPDADLSYGASLSRWTFVKTLAMESMDDDGKIGPFSRSNDTRSEFSTSFLKKFFMHVRQNLAMDLIGPDRQTNPFSRFPVSFLPKYFMDVRQDLNYGANWSLPENRVIFNVKRAPKRTSVKTLTMEAVGPNGKISQFSRSNNPRRGRISYEIFHECFGDPDIQSLFSRNFSWRSVKTLGMDPIGHDGKTGPFSRSNEPRSGFSVSFLPKFFMNVRQDLSYGVGWPRWVNWPIFNVKVPRSGFLASFLPKYFMDVRQDLSYGAGKSTHFQDQTIPGTLAMESVGPEGEIDPFSRSNEPRNDLSYGASWSRRGSQPIFKFLQPLERSIDVLVIRISIKTLAMELVRHDGDPDFGHYFLPKIFVDVRQDLSYGADWSRRVNRPIFMVKRSPDLVKRAKERVNPSFCQFSCAIFHGCFGDPKFGHHFLPKIFIDVRQDLSYGAVHECFGDLDFRRHFCQKFSWMSVKTLDIYPVDSRHRFCPNFLWTSIKTLTMDPVGHDGKTYQFSRSNEPRADLSYGSGWTRWENMPISKVKRSPKRTSVKTLAMEPVCHDGKTDPFSRSNEPQSVQIPCFADFRVHSPWMFWLFGFTASFLLKTIKDVRQDLSYGADWSRRVIRPIFKVKTNPRAAIVHGSSGHPYFRVHFCQKFSWTSVNTLAMEPIGHDGKIIPFSRSNNPRSGFPTSFSPKFFMKVLQNPSYGAASFLSKFFLDIRQNLSYGTTLAIEPIDHNEQTGLFSRSNDHRSRFLVSFLPNFFMDVHQDLSMEPVGHDGFSTSFLMKFFMNVRQNLAIESIGPDRQTNPFSRFPASFLPKYFMDVRQVLTEARGAWVHVNPVTLSWIRALRQDLSYGANWSLPENWVIFKVKRAPERVKPPFYRFSHAIVHGFFSDPDFRCHFFQKISWTSIKTLTMEPVGPDGQIGPFSRSNDPQSSPWMFWLSGFSMSFLPKNFIDVCQDLSYGASWSRWVNRPIFKVKRAPERVNPKFYRFSDVIVHGYFGDVDFRCHVCQKISWMSVKTLDMESVGSDGITGPYSRSNEPRSGHFLPKFFMEIRQNLMYGTGWSRRVNSPIFKVKRALKRSMDFVVIQIFGVIFAEIFYGRPSRPELWSWLVTMGKPAHFLGQMNPGAVMEPIGPDRHTNQFSRSTQAAERFSMSFLPKYFMDVRQDLSYRAGWSIPENWAIFKVKRAPERVKPPFYRFSCGIIHGFFGDPYFRCHFFQKFSWTSVKTLTMEPVGPDGQIDTFSRSNDPRSG
ncbi:hypothetical protein H5410_058946 [Solanum commersonii]|uniref:Uncharacterized protein n=1 Tax=Solanum commersonii TaxID=4109 RepID=A0A9J5W1H3_SOLCO|nr:hypothetical protein H5410_058946 [Solanum commersonii]